MKHLLLLIFSVSALSLLGQRNTFSPFSIYGLGEPSKSSTTAMSSMGHTHAALLDPTMINPINPSSYTDITRPTFNFDVKNELLTLSSGTTTQASNSFSIKNFSFAFPVINDTRKFKRRMGLSFGLAPLTSMGYDLFETEEIPDLGAVEYRFFGDGGINSLHAGIGFDLLTDKKRTNYLSLGANVNYVFGQISKNRVTQLDPASAATNLYRLDNLEISDVDFNSGLRFTHVDTIKRVTYGPDSAKKVTKSIVLFSFGAYVKPASKLNAFTQSVQYTFSDSFTRPSVIDTLTESSGNVATNSPMTFGLGLSMNLSRTWTVSVDYAQTAWSNLVINGTNAGLFDSRRFGIGAQFIPDPFARGKGSYVKNIRYRTGFIFEQTMLNISGSQPLRYGATFGFGFPLSKASSSTSMLNIGAEVARRDTPGISLTETYFNVHAGFTITPHRYDQWFAKRKYD